MYYCCASLRFAIQVVEVPAREEGKPLRVPISGIYKIKGVGDVLAGRVEQGIVKPNDEVRFMPTHTAANKCEGKVFSVEMHHKRVDQAGPGDNVGMNIKGLDKGNMPRQGDVMIMKSDASLKHVEDFTAQIQTLDIPGELKAGYSPIGFVRCGRSACRVMKIDWKVCSLLAVLNQFHVTVLRGFSWWFGPIWAGSAAVHACAYLKVSCTSVCISPPVQVGKETGGKKLEEPHSLKSNEMAQIVFKPAQPLVVDSFKNCEGLSRIAFLDGNTAVMLGKVVKVTHK